MRTIALFLFISLCLFDTTNAQQLPSSTDTRMYDIIEATSADRLESDIRTLAGFGTRNTFSDTLSTTRGIGAARRWIFAEFQKISSECGGCLDVFYQRDLVPAKFPSSIAYVGLSGEEQGLFGGAGLAAYAQEREWDIIGVLNNDMIGNIEGVDGVIDNRTFRIFSEPTPPTETETQRRRRRFYGGEVDGISRQLARYVHKQVKTYMPEMNPMMIYRLDRFGRGGHHRPFNDLGYAGIRIMEAHENYNRQHQDIREENGIKYGDVIEGVNFDYAKKLTAVNAINLAGLAWAPPAPSNVGIGGVVEPSTKLAWDKVSDPQTAGYKIYWRLTTEPQWQYSRYVGDVDKFTLEGIVIDNYVFGVATVGKSGHESLVTFPSRVVRDN